MQCFDDGTTFAGLVFALFFKIFRLPSNHLQKDPYINRYA